MVRYSLVLLLAVLFSGCSEQEKSAERSGGELAGGELAGKVRMDGSSTVFPISEAVAEEFTTVAPGVRVTVGVSGTGGGFKKFLAGEIDITAASRPIKQSEAEEARANGIEFIEVPVAFDGLSVVLNPANDWVDQLTVKELNEIWKPDSTVKTWADVRPGWPNEPIRLYGPGTDSGTFDYFTLAINGAEQSSRADFTASEDDNVLVQGISGDKNALGYFGFAYFVENQDKLKVAPIDGGNGPVIPTIETINNGSYQPLSRPVFIYINPKSLDDPAIAAFIDYYMEKAGVLSEDVGYVSLPAEVYQQAKQRIRDRVTGTAYTESASLPRLTNS